MKTTDTMIAVFWCSINVKAIVCILNIQNTNVKKISRKVLTNTTKYVIINTERKKEVTNNDYYKTDSTDSFKT